MAQNILELIFKADSKDLKAAKVDLSDVKAKFAELSKELPILGSGMSQLSSAFGTVRTSAMAFGAGLASIAVGAAAAVVALGALGIASALKFQAVIDDLGDMADKLGMNVNQLAVLKTSLEDAGTSIQTLQSGADRLAKAMAKSGDDTKGAGEAFKRLGIDTEDTNGKLRSTEDVMKDLTDKYKEANLTATEQADLALALGKNYREVMQAFKVAAEATEEYNLSIERGLGITKKSQEETSKYHKAMREASTVVNSMGSIMVELVIPALTQLTNWFVKSYTEGGTVAAVFNIIAGATRILVTGLTAVTEWLGLVVDWFVMVGKIGVDVFKSIAQALSGDFAGAFGTLKGGFTEYYKGLEGLGTKALELIKKNAGEAVKLFTDFRDGKFNFVGEAQKQIRNENQSSKSVIGFTGSAGGTATGGKEDKVEDPNKGINSLIEALTRQKIAMEELNKVAIVTNELNDPKYSKADEKLKAQAKDIALTIDNANAKKQLDNATRSLNKSADSYADRLKDEVSQMNMSKRDYEEMIEFRKLDAQYTEELNKLREKGLLTTEREIELQEKLAASKKKVADATNEAQERDKDWATRGVNDYLKGIGTLDDAMTKWVSGSLKAVEDSMYSLFTTGDFSFKSLAKTIISSLAQMAIQFLIMKPIIEWFKSAMSSIGSGGGWGAAISAIFSAQGNVIGSNFANGGVMRPGPQRFFAAGGMNLANEAGDEAIMPLKRNAAGDLGVVSSGASSKQTIVHNQMSVNIGNVDSAERQAALMREISKMIEAGSKRVYHEEKRNGR